MRFVILLSLFLALRVTGLTKTYLGHYEIAEIKVVGGKDEDITYIFERSSTPNSVVIEATTTSDDVVTIDRGNSSVATVTFSAPTSAPTTKEVDPDTESTGDSQSGVSRITGNLFNVVALLISLSVLGRFKLRYALLLLGILFVISPVFGQNDTEAPTDAPAPSYEVKLTLGAGVCLINGDDRHYIISEYCPGDIGDRIYRQWELFPHTLADVGNNINKFTYMDKCGPDQLDCSAPLTTDMALARNWTKISNVCDPKLGELWGHANIPTQQLYFTSAGQIAGMKVIEIGGFGALPDRWIADGYYRMDGGESINYYSAISYRAPADMCSGAISDKLLGDRLVLNQDTLAISLPLTTYAAKAANWGSGSIFDRMGWHWGKDIDGGKVFSGDYNTFFPVVLMYWNGKINAYFFHTPNFQPTGDPWVRDMLGIAGVPNVIGWDPPFALASPSGTCGNFCGSGCFFYGNPHQSVMHVFLKNPFNVNVLGEDSPYTSISEFSDPRGFPGNDTCVPAATFNPPSPFSAFAPDRYWGCCPGGYDTTDSLRWAPYNKTTDGNFKANTTFWKPDLHTD